MTIDDAIKHCNEVVAEKGNCDCATEHKQLLEWLTEYRALKEKQMPKIPIEGDEHRKCPVCKSDVLPYIHYFCENCGQAIDWGDDE